MKLIKPPLTGDAYIVPSILAADIGALRQEIESVTKSGADWLHIDVMDGSFVPPITFGENVVALARKTCNIFLDVHLMISNPTEHLTRFRDAGCDRLIVHQETCPHLYRTLSEIRSLGILNGVALNPGTAAESIFDALEVADLVLVMTVSPGWGGQSFIPSMLSKIERLNEEIKRRKLGALIEVDGGITPSTAQNCFAAGARVLVAGSAIFGVADRPKAIRELAQIKQ